jgi:hypothetical protein
MKIMAAFDGTKFSESILHQLTLMAAIPGAEFTLIAVAHEPDAKLRRRGRARPIGLTNAMGAGEAFVVGVTEPTFAEDKTQAIERRMSDLRTTSSDSRTAPAAQRATSRHTSRTTLRR